MTPLRAGIFTGLRELDKQIEVCLIVGKPLLRLLAEPELRPAAISG